MFNTNESFLFGLRIKQISIHFFVCRATASEYIIPYRKFIKSLNRPVCIGARINFQCHNEDVSERSVSFQFELISVVFITFLFLTFYVFRRSGMVVGISEVDSVKWPGSKWRSLLVCISADFIKDSKISLLRAACQAFICMFFWRLVGFW